MSLTSCLNAKSDDRTLLSLLVPYRVLRPRVVLVDGAGFSFLRAMRWLILIVLLAPLVAVALRGDWVATGIVAFLYLALA